MGDFEEMGREIKNETEIELVGDGNVKKLFLVVVGISLYCFQFVIRNSRYANQEWKKFLLSSSYGECGEIRPWKC